MRTQLAVASAVAVFEARLVVARHGGTEEQDKLLHALEMRYYEMAEADRVTPKRKRKKPAEKP
jgi:hypothetical protein